MSPSAALLADGADAALVRCSIVDASGTLASAATHNISFSVVAGPGRVLGVGNGDPSSHQPNVASSRLAYGGLARAVVQVTVDAVSPGRGLQAFIDNVRSTSGDAPVEDIIVAATAPGLVGGKLTIPVSVDSRDSVLAVARRSVEVELELQ